MFSCLHKVMEMLYWYIHPVFYCQCSCEITDNRGCNPVCVSHCRRIGGWAMWPDHRNNSPSGKAIEVNMRPTSVYTSTAECFEPVSAHISAGNRLHSSFRRSQSNEQHCSAVWEFNLALKPLDHKNRRTSCAYAICEIIYSSVDFFPLPI